MQSVYIVYLCQCHNRQKSLVECVHCRCAALDMRGHGDTYTADDSDLSSQTLTRLVTLFGLLLCHKCFIFKLIMSVDKYNRVIQKYIAKEDYTFVNFTKGRKFFSLYVFININRNTVPERYR